MKDLLDFRELFDSKEKESKLSSIGVNSTVDTKQTISSGILTLDLITSGGLQRGRAYEIIGPEHGGKTTILYSCFGQAIKCIPRKLKGIFLDIEGLVDPTWFGHITVQESMDGVFGKKDKDGEWIIEPQIRYYKPSFGEQGLKFIKRVLKVMPDKILIGSTWYHMWSPRAPKVVTKVGGWTIEDLRRTLDGRYSKKLLTKYGNFYVPIDDNYGGPEMIIGVDSWVAMTPEAIAEEDSDAMASQARMFAKHLNDVKSLISAKGVALVGINQIRMTPMCLSHDVNILLKDGTTKQIGDIVDNKLSLTVMSYNFGNESFELKNITNWFNNGVSVYREFKIVTFEIDGLSFILKITPDHYIFTNNEKIKVKDLKIGDKLLSMSPVGLKNAIVTKIEDSLFLHLQRYDIEVEDNHNYFANGILVSNSYGNPESTPGGNTLKHMTDVRIRVQAISNQNGKGMTEEEDTDAYRHFKLKTVKNKTFIPFLEAAGRWWINHDGNSGYGPDPVQDVLNYLKMTSQFKPDKKGFYIKFISKSEKLLALRETRFTYDTFKELVLSKKLGKIDIDLKKICHKQISHGNGLELYLSGNPADLIVEEKLDESED